jgi:predicted TIM-barrel fold metal-dependent hydrolase
VWQETTRQPRNRRIWDEELEDFVPKRVLDFHVHVCNRATIRGEKGLTPGGQSLDQYDLEDLSRDLGDAYPGRITKAVCFGMPSTTYDKAANDRYMAEACDSERFFPLRLLDPFEDPADVRADVEASGFLGFKPYLNYVRKDDPNQVEIREMLPEPLMQIADDLGLIVMLHIPRKERLADPLNQEQLKELCLAFPRAQVVLAHIGRAYFLKNIVGHIEPLAELDNLYIDLAMLNNWEVLEHAFRVFPHERILYGTDAPIALAPGKSVEINDQYTYVTPVPWHLSITDDHGKLVFTSFLYEELRAIRKAVERLGLDRAFVENLFHDNGMRLLERVLSGQKERKA